MLTYAKKRVAFMILVLLVVSLITFALFFTGDPHEIATRYAGRGASDEVIHAAYLRLGLDHGFWHQYTTFLSRVVRGDFGTDFQTGQSVTSEILHRFPITLSVAVGAVVLWLLMGIPIGIQSATRPRSLRDRLATVFSLAFMSIPVFVLGMVALLVLYYYLTRAGVPLFPPGGYVPLTQNPGQWLMHLLLPWVCLALTNAAIYARLTRTSMLEVMGEDYVRAARSRGLSRRRVLYGHTLRAALTPMMTQLGIDVGILLGGTIVVEQVFSLQGVGQFALQAVLAGNLPVVAATTLIAAFFIVAANAIVDICYGWVDPRARVR